MTQTFRVSIYGHNITRLLKKLQINLEKLPDTIINGQLSEVYKIEDIIIYDYWKYELILNETNLIINLYANVNQTFSYTLNEDERNIIIQCCNWL